jgi:hypothetical protein
MGTKYHPPGEKRTGDRARLPALAKDCGILTTVCIAFKSVNRFSPQHTNKSKLFSDRIVLREQS